MIPNFWQGRWCHSTIKNEERTRKASHHAGLGHAVFPGPVARMRPVKG